MECIVLAGGLGTRLQTVVHELPKCMAPVNGNPFMHYVFNFLERQYCTRVILSLGYKHEYITNWLQTQNRSFITDYVIENEPLGTGGGIQLAMMEAKEEQVFVLNGDTMFNIELSKFSVFHHAHKSDTTIALKFMEQFDRYGVVETVADDCISSFGEKQYRDRGYINGGIYLMERDTFLNKKLPEKFSFEKDYLEAFADERRFFGYKSDDYFIDIGIPEDYHRAEEDFKKLF